VSRNRDPAVTLLRFPWRRPDRHRVGERPRRRHPPSMRRPPTRGGRAVRRRDVV